MECPYCGFDSIYTPCPKCKAAKPITVLNVQEKHNETDNKEKSDKEEK